MTDDPTPDETSGDRSHRDQNPRRLRLPKIDFVTLILALLVAVILLFLTAELWLPHFGD
jgi:hypothetical protein